MTFGTLYICLFDKITITLDVTWFKRWASVSAIFFCNVFVLTMDHGERLYTQADLVHAAVGGHARLSTKGTGPNSVA